MKVTTFRQLLDEQARAAARISGARGSAFNGRTMTLDPDRKARGVAGPDGTLYYKESDVVVPLRQMFEYAQHYNQPEADLVSYRQALKTFLHENTHLLTADPRTYEASSATYVNPAVKVLEEGVTEAYAQAHLDDYINELGLEEIAPGIGGVKERPSYKAYTPAAERFAGALARGARLDQDEVLRRLAIVSMEQKYTTAAELVYDSSDLARMNLSAQDRQAAIQRISTAMQEPMAKLVASEEKSFGPEIRRQSAKTGAMAVQSGYDMARTIRTELQDPTAVAVRTQSRYQVRQQGPARDAPAEPQLEDAMRAAFSGTAQMHSVRRLEASALGARGHSAHATRERHGPQQDV